MTRKLYTVLIVEADDADFDAIARHLLSIKNPKYEIVRARDVRTAMELSQTEDISAAIVARDLEDESGVDFLEAIGGREASFPVILLTDCVDTDFELEAVNRGASDCVPKISMARALIDRSIRFSVRGHEYNQSLREAKDAAAAHARLNRHILGLVGHELRAPIESFLCYQEYIAENARDEAIANAAVRARAAAEHMLDFIRNLAEFVRIERGQGSLSQKPFPLEEFIVCALDLFRPYADHKNITIKHHISPEANANYLGDPLRLRQVLVNFLRNAVAHSSDGVIEVRASYVDGALIMQVSDQGVGMSPEKIAQILSDHEFIQPVDASIDSGLGLGLAISKRLINLMGGRLELESIVGVGTKIRIRIPLEKINADTGRMAEAI